MRTSLAFVMICSIASSTGCSQKSPAPAATPPVTASQNQSPVASDQSKKVDSAQGADANSTAATKKSSRIDELFALMKAGDMEKACEFLLTMSEQDLMATSSTERLWNLSEEQVTQMPPADRTVIQQEVLVFVPKFSMLRRHCMSKGEEFLKSNDHESARRHFEAVRQLGRTFSAPNRLLVFRNGGDNFIKHAEEALSRSVKK